MPPVVKRSFSDCAGADWEFREAALRGALDYDVRRGKQHKANSNIVNTTTRISYELTQSMDIRLHALLAGLLGRIAAVPETACTMDTYAAAARGD